MDKKVNAGEARNAASSYLGKLPEKLTPEEQGLAKEGMAAQFDRDLSQQEVLQGETRFEASGKQPWDTYSRDSIVAQSPQNVEMDNYSTNVVDKPNLGQLSSVTKPNDITAPISKPPPSVVKPSALMTAQENYQQRLAAEAAAKRSHEMAKEDKRGGYKKESADIGGKARIKSAGISAHPRNVEANLHVKKFQVTEDDITSRIEQDPKRYEIVRDGQVVGYNRSLAKSDAVKDTKMALGGAGSTYQRMDEADKMELANINRQLQAINKNNLDNAGTDFVDTASAGPMLEAKRQILSKYGREVIPTFAEAKKRYPQMDEQGYQDFLDVQSTGE